MIAHVTLMNEFSPLGTVTRSGTCGAETFVEDF